MSGGDAADRGSPAGEAASEDEGEELVPPTGGLTLATPLPDLSEHLPRLILVEVPAAPGPVIDLEDAAEHALAWAVWLGLVTLVIALPIGQVTVLWPAQDVGYGDLGLVGPAPTIIDVQAWFTLESGPVLAIWLAGLMAIIAGWCFGPWRPWGATRPAPAGVWLLGRGGLAALAAVLLANVAITLAFLMLAFLAGWEIDQPPVDEFTVAQLWAALFNAGVWEELVTRVMLLGVPLWLIMRLRGRDISALALWRGGLLEHGWSPTALILLLASSILFGWWHIDQYGAWKVLPTIIGGLGFGWLYLRGGLAPAVLAHTLLDVATFQAMWLVTEELTFVVCLMVLATLPAFVLSAPLLWRLGTWEVRALVDRRAATEAAAAARSARDQEA